MKLKKYIFEEDVIGDGIYIENKKDKILICFTCNNNFVFRIGEQYFFEKHNLTQPKRCKICRDINKKEKFKQKSNNIKLSNLNNEKIILKKVIKKDNSIKNIVRLMLIYNGNKKVILSKRCINEIEKTGKNKFNIKKSKSVILEDIEGKPITNETIHNIVDGSILILKTKIF